MTLKSIVQFFAINLLSKISTSPHLQIEDCMNSSPLQSPHSNKALNTLILHMTSSNRLGIQSRGTDKAEAQLQQQSYLKAANLCIGQCKVAVDIADLQLMLGCACN